MIRKPSDRSTLFARWRERIANVRPNEWHPEQPECGLYMAKRKGGVYAAIQIDVEQEIEDGELVAEETFVAWMNGDRFVGERVFDIWQRCGGRPLTETEFARVAALPQNLRDLRHTAVT